MSRIMLNRGARWGAGISALTIAFHLCAAPFVPSEDAQVLERLPDRATIQFRQRKALQDALAQAPADSARAAALASAYIRAARAEGDPRYLGYAQAALAPWWRDPAAPSAVVVLRATILQGSHQFDAASTDLGIVLQRDPGNVQALLTRATILTVQGRYAAARGDCTRLAGRVPEIYAATCRATIDSLTGRADAAYESLQRSLAASPRIDAAARVWAETLLGEIAHRRGAPAAERHFRAALDGVDKDPYLLGAYSDWLLDQGRPGDVLRLLRNETRVDALLLRLTLAQHALGRPEAAASIDLLRSRFDASAMRGDTIHQRERARFELYLRGDAASALALALDNWKVQREPADLAILAAAASAANDAGARAVVRHWLAETAIEYPAVAALAGRAPR